MMERSRISHSIPVITDLLLLRRTPYRCGIWSKAVGVLGRMFIDDSATQADSETLSRMLDTPPSSKYKGRTIHFYDDGANLIVTYLESHQV